jgi:biopolymer transport protein TolR
MSTQTKSSSGARGTLRSDINVTPLVDICLVLLIIFLVITPRLCNSSAVPLPETRNPMRLAGDTLRTTVALDTNGLVYVDRRLVPEERLATTLADLESSRPDRLIVVEAHHRLPYRDVRRLVERLQAAGLSKVALAAELRGR